MDYNHDGDGLGDIDNGIVEKDYTLKISKYMYDCFKEVGIPVIMTRENDVTLTPI